MLNLSPYTPSDLQAMRDWLADCSWYDLDPDDLAELSDAEVVRGVSRHYDGGLKQFFVDQQPVLIAV